VAPVVAHAGSDLSVLPETRRSLLRLLVSGRGWGTLALPGLAFLLIFFGWPVVDILLRSLTDPSPSNYKIFSDSPIYRDAYFTTFRIAGLTTLGCLVLGYPYAYLMHLSGRRVTAILTLFVLLPFWQSVLVRTYAWTVWLQDTGLINDLLRDLGLTSKPVALVRNDIGTTIGMVQVTMPFMILTVYAGMQRIDRDLVPAAQSLGAKPWLAFRKVFLPLSMPGVYAGMLLVFVISLGFYITPELLGSPSSQMVGQIIVDQVNRQLAFGVGSALGLVLLVLTLAVLAIGARAVNIARILGYDDA
jgi:putative spermidine/putrescine transport system permease protein